MSDPKFIVVAGASAGGYNSVVELCAQLTDEMDVAVFVVLHISHFSFGDILLYRLQKNTAFTCKMAKDGEPIRSKHVYLAVPDKHLVLEEGKIILGQGPAENRWRPSIDVLFRSAAAAYDGRVIGIILTGLLQDGTAGMLAIKRCGGTCIVQDPDQAEYPDMPLSVLNHMQVDYCVRLEEMGSIIKEKSENGIAPKVAVPADVQAEAEIARKSAVGMDKLKELGKRSDYSCPDCGGGLWEMVQDNIVRYRCYTGHSYNQDELFTKQDEHLELTLWTALRMMEERKSLLDKMWREEEERGWMLTANSKKERAKDLEGHINRLKKILFDAKNS